MFSDHEWNVEEVEAEAWADGLEEEFRAELAADQPKTRPVSDATSSQAPPPESSDVATQPDQAAY